MNNKKRIIRLSLIEAILNILKAMVLLGIVDATTATNLARILKDTIIDDRKIAFVYYVADEESLLKPDRFLKPEPQMTAEQIVKKIMDDVLDEQAKKKN